MSAGPARPAVAPTVPYCADDAGAAGRVAELITGTGWSPVPAGGLHRAAYLEATAAFEIGVWWAGGSPYLASPEAPGRTG